MPTSFVFFGKNRWLSVLLITVFLGGCAVSRESGTPSPTASSRGAHLSASEPESQYVNTPITIDGSDSDWIGLHPVISSERISWVMARDADNLYILVSSRDPETQLRILEGGMTLWLNTHGKNDVNGASAVAFPLGGRQQNNYLKNDKLSADDIRGRKMVDLANVRSYVLMNFDSSHPIASFPYGEENPFGMEFRINIDTHDKLVYEACIPLSALLGDSGLHDKMISVGLSIEGLVITEKQHSGHKGFSPDVEVEGGVGGGSWGSGTSLGISIGGVIGGGKSDETENQTVYAGSGWWKSFYLK